MGLSDNSIHHRCGSNVRKTTTHLAQPVVNYADQGSSCVSYIPPAQTGTSKPTRVPQRWCHATPYLYMKPASRNELASQVICPPHVPCRFWTLQMSLFWTAYGDCLSCGTPSAYTEFELRLRSFSSFHSRSDHRPVQLKSVLNASSQSCQRGSCISPVHAPCKIFRLRTPDCR